MVAAASTIDMFFVDELRYDAAAGRPWTGMVESRPASAGEPRNEQKQMDEFRRSAGEG